MTVYQCILNVQSALSKEGVPKDRKNVQQNYSFRGIDDILATLAPLITEHGLLILPFVQERTVTECQSKGGGTLFYTAVLVDYVFVCVEDGTTHTVRSAGEAMDSGDKSTNKAMSSAYKNMAIQAFCIRTEGDNDTENTSHEVVGSSRKPQAVSKSAPSRQAAAPATKPSCPSCGEVESVINNQYGKTKWLCWVKKEGCGRAFEDEDSTVDQAYAAQEQQPT